MAPEQHGHGAADARSDVFSFCVALYEALYGERPFAGSDLPGVKSAIQKGLIRKAPLMTRVPAWLRGVLLRGLRADPAERFSSMRELLDALRAASQASSRRRGRILAMAVGGFVLCGGVLAYVEAAGRVSPPRAVRPAPESEGSASAAQTSSRSAQPLPSATLAVDAAAGTAQSAVVAAQPIETPAIRPPPRPIPRRAVTGSSSAARTPPPLGKNGAFILD
jgi:serine/threonine protein kinase